MRPTRGGVGETWAGRVAVRRWGRLVWSAPFQSPAAIASLSPTSLSPTSPPSSSSSRLFHDIHEWQWTSEAVDANLTLHSHAGGSAPAGRRHPIPSPKIK